MISFTAILQKFGEHGEKTGWTYAMVPGAAAKKIKPNNKKSFRVKGKIDSYDLTGVALIPMGEGNFIMAVNATMRKAIKKTHGAMVVLELEEDRIPTKLAVDLVECLADEPEALRYFNSLSPSHRNWYSNWVKAAKTEPTKAKRIVAVVKSCLHKLDFSEMMKGYREGKNFIQ